MNMSKVIGTCALCLTPGSELRNSHILPKWAYRRIMDQQAIGGDRNPVKIHAGKAIQTSEQLVEPLLCTACEGKLSTDEDLVSRLGYQEDDSLGLKQPYRFEVEPDLFAAPIDLATSRGLARFAASIFWRAPVAP